MTIMTIYFIGPNVDIEDLNIEWHDNMEDAVNYCFDKAREFLQDILDEIPEKEYTKDIQALLDGMDDDQDHFKIGESIKYTVDDYEFQAMIIIQ